MILVLAGVNGAGKSSVLGSHLRAKRGDYFNPDEYARRLLDSGKVEQQDDANANAWQMGFKALLNAVQHDRDYAFETTLGGNRITATLEQAIQQQIEVRVVFVGLASPELHIERVRARVQRGGHAIAESRIRQRYEDTRINLIRLIQSGLTELAVWDNSAPLIGGQPAPAKLFHYRQQIWKLPPDRHCPQWAKSIAVAAMQQLAG